jgi:hypothetical protein
MRNSRSIRTKEAALMLRTLLRRRYPAVRFSVRFESYSMGSHITIRWTDGPASRTIEEMSAPFSGSRFDGSCDGSYYVESWLLPDGSAVCATTGADGYNSGATTLPPCEGAELVMFSGSTPSCDREISPEYEAACTKAWAGLDGHQHCVLLNEPRFPRWEGCSEGYKLAWFFDADQIAPARKAA